MIPNIFSNKGGHMKTTLKVMIGLAAVALIITAASAQFSKPEEAIKYRQAAMFLIGQHFSRLGAMVKGQQPYDREAFARNAALVETLSKLPWEAFLVAGSDEGETTMKSDVLRNQPKFKEAAEQMETEVAKLVTAANADDFNATKAQFGAVGKTCKNCHGEFRK